MRRGRRPGGENTRALILEAARTEFAATGYDGTSIRGVARTAGVDPRLVHHYFDGKSDLFAAVMAVPINPGARVMHALEGPPQGLGARLVAVFIETWDDPDNQAALIGAVRTTLTNHEAAQQVREFVTQEIMSRVVDAYPATSTLTAAERELRVGLVTTQMVGLAMTRYILRLPEISDLCAEELIARNGPAIQGILETGSAAGTPLVGQPAKD